ncbi:hypothetical protein FQN60_008684 [Etheostoma spectabile]|uniref:LIM zinc-binding domain-containing protein n=1 Tax=Etheostoma spectabile TaxID=54343 RepID=A0A5J5CJF1_9PERO|nr:hypothetical protein FQN60_008684 [Etheostoma spectabile]
MFALTPQPHLFCLSCAAEKVSSLGKDWHKLCLKCDRCNKLLNAGGHAEAWYVKGYDPRRNTDCFFKRSRGQIGAHCGLSSVGRMRAAASSGWWQRARLERKSFPFATQALASCPWHSLGSSLLWALGSGPVATHDGRPYCHKPCYAALFGPKGVNIGGAGSYVYDTPANNNPSPTSVDSAPKAEEKRVFAPKAASKGKGKTGKGLASPCRAVEGEDRVLA